MSREINIKLEAVAFTSDDVERFIDEINREIEDGDKISLTPTKIDFVIIAVFVAQFLLLTAMIYLFNA